MNILTGDQHKTDTYKGALLIAAITLLTILMFSGAFIAFDGFDVLMPNWSYSRRYAVTMAFGYVFVSVALSMILVAEYVISCVAQRRFDPALQRGYAFFPILVVALSFQSGAAFLASLRL